MDSCFDFKSIHCFFALSIIASNSMSEGLFFIDSSFKSFAIVFKFEDLCTNLSIVENRKIIIFHPFIKDFL